MLLAASAWTLHPGPGRADPNVPIPDGYRLDDYRAAVPDSVPGAQVLHLAAMRDVVAARQAVLIDVLPAPRRPEAMRPGLPWLPTPHLSLPGSLWWPDIGRGAIPPDLEAALLLRLHQAVSGDPARLMVFFCLNDCWMSWNATRRVARAGFHAAWFPEGADGWAAAGLPVMPVTPDPLE